MSEEQVVAHTRYWIERFVVGLNLCPFARRPLQEDEAVRFVVSAAGDEAALLAALSAELEMLRDNAAIETTLLIHPGVLQDFYAYNHFLGEVEQLLSALQLEGIFQVASFHPDYQFAGTDPDDAENYSNRSPYPMLHLLREDSVAQAVATHPEVESVPANNIATLNALGAHQLQALRQSCINE